MAQKRNKAVRQNHLKELENVPSRYLGGKWGRYLRAPDFFFEIAKKLGDRLVPVAEIAEVRFGVKSGCDDFFFPSDYTAEALESEPSPSGFKDHYGASRASVLSEHVRIVKAGDGTVWPIEAEFLEREVHSLMQVKSVTVNSSTLPRWVLLVSEPKTNLRHRLIHEYIRYGEKETFGGDEVVSKRSTCASRSPWYDLTGIMRGDVLWSMTHKYRHIAPANPNGLICNHRLFAVRARNQDLRGCLAPALNSTIVAFFKHFYGRYAGMEHTLDTEVIDVNMLPIPDIRRANSSQRESLERAFAKMSEREIDYFLEDEFLGMVPLDRLKGMASLPPRLPGELRHPDRRELDQAVLAILGVGSDEVGGVLDRLYAETTLLYRRGRILDIRTAANKRNTKKGASASPQQIADSVMQGLTPGTVKLYPQDFMESDEPVDHYVLPSGRGRMVEDLFHKPRLRFRDEEIEFRHREQALLALDLHNAGADGAVTVPIDEARCKEVKCSWTTYVSAIEQRFEEEAAQWTPDEDKAEAAVSILLRRMFSA